MKNKDTVISVINNEYLYFLDIDAHSNVGICHHLPVEHFLSEIEDTVVIPQELKQKINTLLIVPDYWFGSALYKFKATTRSLIESFLERKLQSEYPDRSDVLNFFEYTFSQTGREDQGLYVFFLQEPKSFQLYNRLAEFKLSPRRITTPAYLWEQKLNKKIPDFQDGGTGLIHLLFSSCFLYFYYRGHFLFSRSIALPDFDSGSSERLGALSFEINQSLYLFSQKTKSDVGRFYLCAPTENICQELSEVLTREVKDLGLNDEERLGIAESAENLGPVESFNAADLSPSAKFPSISHKSLKKELKWKPIQIAGIAIGLILVLLLALEAYFLRDWFQLYPVRMRRAGIQTPADSRQIIQEYNDAMDLLLAETERPSAKNTIIRIGEALPDNVWIKDMSVETQINPSVDLKGVVYAYGADHLRDSLTIFLSNLNAQFQGSRSVSIKDIDFEAMNSKKETEYSAYLFAIKFDLP